MAGEELPQETYQCSHCEDLGEISFSCFQRQHQNDHGTCKVWVKNLPKNIKESGLENLFLTIGKPVSIGFNPRTNSAVVEFNYRHEADLAVRDLHDKPPYNLKVTTKFNIQKVANKNKGKADTPSECEVWDFSVKEEPNDVAQDEIGNICAKSNDRVDFVRRIISKLSHDPSVRMRQKLLDFENDYECISFGRGYLFRGKTNNFVGGLQKFESTSKNSQAKNKMRFSCQNCNSLTTKICGRCSASYCSKTCLSAGDIDHKTCDGLSDDADKQTSSNLDKTFDRSHNQVPLPSGCTVVITMYQTMQVVFVRRIDESWEEKFARLCNDVAAEAFKGEKFKKSPVSGDLVIAKYHEDCSYYRARVISRNKNRVKVFFVDFGNIQQTDLDDLKPLPDHLKTESFAAKVFLKGVSNDSSQNSVDYYNTLTAERVPLIMNFDCATSEVVLIEKDSKAVVNRTVMEHTLPSWKREGYVFSKSGETFYVNSLMQTELKFGATRNILVSHFDEEEFLERDVFWVTKPDTDEFLHAYSEMYLRMREYCEFLKNDCYLPRVNELCLAKERGEWYRCFNLGNEKTVSCLFFLDEGFSSPVKSSNIRKMIEDFMEIPSQAICCFLPEEQRQKGNKKLEAAVIKYLKEAVGRLIESAEVLKLVGDNYCLSIPELSNIIQQK